MTSQTIIVGRFSPDITGWATFTTVDGVTTWSKIFLSWSTIAYQLSDGGRSYRMFTGPTQASVLAEESVYGDALNRAVGELVLALYEPPPGYSVISRTVFHSYDYVVIIDDTPGLPLPPIEFSGFGSGATAADAPRGVLGPPLLLATASLPVACQPSGAGAVSLMGGRNVAVGPADYAETAGVVMRPEYTYASGNGEFRPVGTPGALYAVVLDDSPPLLFRVPSCCSRLDLDLQTPHAGGLTSGHAPAGDWRLRGGSRLGARGLSGLEDTRRRSRDAAAETEFILGRTEL